MGFPTQKQKLDYLFKKIGFSAAKTGVAIDESDSDFNSDTKKDGSNESIASPLIVPASSIWADSGSIPASPPGSDSAYVEGYRTANAYRMTYDNTVSNERAFIARSTVGSQSASIDGDWIDTQFGADYIVKVYKGDPNAGGTQVSAAGSGANDTWFFDYAAGVLNFNGEVDVAGVGTDNIYILGYRYTGTKGSQPPGGIGTFNNLYVSGIATVAGLLDANGGLTANTAIVEDLTNNRVVIAGTGGELEDDSNLTFDGSTLAVGVGLDVTGKSTLTKEVGISSALSVSGVSTFVGIASFSSLVDFDGGIAATTAKVEDLTSGRVTYAGAGGELQDSGNLTFDGTDLTAASAKISDLTDNRVVIAGTSGALEDSGNLTFDGTTLGLTGNQTISGTIDVDGRSELDNVNIAENLNVTGVSTFVGVSTFGATVLAQKSVQIAENLNVTGVTTITGTIGLGTDINLPDHAKATFGDDADLSIYHTGSDSLIKNTTGQLALKTPQWGVQGTGAEGYNIYCVAGAQIQLYYAGNERFKTTGYGVSITGGSSGIGTIAGPATLHIDPAAVGDDTGIVRIKGDLIVDGEQTIINSTTLEISDFIVGIASTATTDALADGAGIKIGPDNTLLYDHTNTSLKSSENFNLPSGKTYKISGTDVLSATVLGDGVISSRLTTVDTLNHLKVAGISTLVGGSIITGITTITQLQVGTTGQTLVGITTILDEDNMASNSAAALATQQSIKAYVDTQVTAQDLDFAGDTGTGTVDIDSETLTLAGTSNEIETSASGQTITIGLPNDVTIGNNLTVTGKSTLTKEVGISSALTVAGVSTFSSDIKLPDNVSVKFGGGEDGAIKHTGSNLQIQEGTGNIQITNYANDKDVVINTDDGSGNTANYFKADGSTGEAILYNYGNERIRTTGTGVTITDTLNVAGVSTFTGAIDANSDLDVDGFTELDDLNVSGITTTVTLNVGTSGQSLVGITTILDEDNMASDSAAALATQQSIKAYVDTQLTAEDLDFAGDSGTGSVDLDGETLTLAGTSNEIETSASNQTITIGLPDDVTIGNDLTVTGDIASVTNLNVTGFATVTKDLDVLANAGIGSLSVTGVSTFTGISTFSSTLLTQKSVQIEENLNVTGITTIAGQTDLNGHVNLGNALSDPITVNGKIDSALIPWSDDGYDLGTSGTQWRHLYVSKTLHSLQVNTSGITTTLTFNVGTTGQSGLVGITTILDEDNMASNSATALVTQQSVKAYVDSNLTAQDLDITTDSGTIDIDLDDETLSISGTSNEIETSATGTAVTIGLPNDVTIGNNLTVTNKSTLTKEVGISSALSVAGVSTFVGITSFTALADFDGGIAATTAKVEDLTAGRVVTVKSDKSLEDSGNLTFDGSTLLVTGTLNSTVDVQINGTSVADSALNDAVAMAIALG